MRKGTWSSASLSRPSLSASNLVKSSSRSALNSRGGSGGVFEGGGGGVEVPRCGRQGEGGDFQKARSLRWEGGSSAELKTILIFKRDEENWGLGPTFRKVALLVDKFVPTHFLTRC